MELKRAHILLISKWQLELRQYKNDSMDWKIFFILNLPRVFSHQIGKRKRAAISKQRNIFSPFRRSYIFLALTNGKLKVSRDAGIGKYAFRHNFFKNSSFLLKNVPGLLLKMHSRRKYTLRYVLDFIFRSSNYCSKTFSSVILSCSFGTFKNLQNCSIFFKT